MKNNYLTAAMLIADRMVTNEFFTTPLMSNTDDTTAFVRDDGERDLVLDIGGGEELELKWIHPLKLWVGKHEITNGQFRRFKPAHNSLFRDAYSLNGETQPVARVSWHDAKAYCDWLNGTFRDDLSERITFRLPLSHEWSLIARCGDNRKSSLGKYTAPIPWKLFGSICQREAP